MSTEEHLKMLADSIVELVEKNAALEERVRVIEAWARQVRRSPTVFTEDYGSAEREPRR
jgi:hypothetical protein